MPRLVSNGREAMLFWKSDGRVWVYRDRATLALLLGADGRPRGEPIVLLSLSAWRAAVASTESGFGVLTTGLLTRLIARDNADGFSPRRRSAAAAARRFSLAMASGFWRSCTTTMSSRRCSSSRTARARLRVRLTNSQFHFASAAWTGSSWLVAHVERDETVTVTEIDAAGTAELSRERMRTLLLPPSLIVHAGVPLLAWSPRATNSHGKPSIVIDARPFDMPACPQASRRRRASRRTPFARRGSLHAGRARSSDAISAEKLGSAVLVLECDAPPQQVSGYRIEIRGRDGVWEEQERFFRADERRFEDAHARTGLAFRVRAINHGGPGAYSNAVFVDAARRRAVR